MRIRASAPIPRGYGLVRVELFSDEVVVWPVPFNLLGRGFELARQWLKLPGFPSQSELVASRALDQLEEIRRVSECPDEMKLVDWVRRMRN